ncbi:MAG: site-specific DNA-methyltransferase [Planctomycetaceae bacterium]|nr:site-specific DNA-methyltransferase [Planctomycetaceae bacterium]MBP62584.1 site-specific DNA-methyltransferase [Planctomycetaceae bacterium]
MTLSANKVYQGDCIQQLGNVKPASVDLVFADPPFNIGYEYDVYQDQRSQDEYLSWSREWMTSVSNVLKPSGTFWLASGDEFAAELKLIAQNEIGLTCRSWVIWYYTFGVNCVQAFSRSHTHLFHFVKDPGDFTFNNDNPAVRVLSARQLVYADGRANAKGRLPDNTWILRPQDAPESGFDPSHDTWFFSRVAGTFKEREGFHGCQMPEQLLGRIIRVSSNPGELVLDPFAGSGTTLAVAKKLGRQWLGIELSRDYVSKIKNRVNGCHGGDPLDGPADARKSAPTTSRGKSKVRLRNGRPVPRLDEETERGIIAAFQATCDGHSTDFMLCEPELNANFVNACQEKAIPGDAYAWNRLLLRIRKSGKLPKARQARSRLTFSEMDPYSAASEVAMHLLSLDFSLTFDEILCGPQTAVQFDHLAKEFATGYTPFQYRWAALSIRKRAQKSKLLAVKHFGEWLDQELPRSLPLARSVSTKHEQPGVYIVLNHNQPLYVGETTNVKNRVEQMLDDQCGWMHLGPRSVKIISTDNPAIQHGLQSILIQRLNPLFNSRLLLPELKVASEFSTSR